MELLNNDVFKKEMETEKEGPHQAILNVAYAPWSKEENRQWGYEDMIENTESTYGDVAAFAVLVGKYNQQVTNGGHQQYYDNAYASGDRKRLEDMGLHLQMMDWMKESGLDKNSVGKEVYEIMDEFLNAVQEPDEDELETECDDCGGVGEVSKNCTECDGDGKVENDEGGEEDCGNCDGSGEVTEECERCGGDGHYRKEDVGPLSQQTLDAWDKLDTRYYAIDDEWMKLLEVYFKEWIEKGKDPLRESKVKVKKEAIATRGSAKIENLEDTDYRVGSSTAGGYILIDKETGKAELWGVHSSPISGYNIKYGNKYLEFISEYKKEGDCPDCEGTGRTEYIGSNRGEMDCENCGGTGMVKKETRACSTCGGHGTTEKDDDGHIVPDLDDCPDCEGKGMIDEPDEEDIVTEDYMNYYVFGTGKPWFRISQDEYDTLSTKQLNQKIKMKMRREGFYPSVYFISDHGNTMLIDLDSDL